MAGHVAPCIDGPLLRGWTVGGVRLILVMAFNTGDEPDAALLLYQTRYGQYVAFQRRTAVAAWAVGVNVRDVLRWCADYAGWLSRTR
jgi:hypothetical protein